MLISYIVPWSLKSATQFIEICKKIAPRYKMDPSTDFTSDSLAFRFFHMFSFTAQGVLNPLCAFMGGYVAQEAIKAITQKYTPTQQFFYYDALEVTPHIDPTIDLSSEEIFNAFLDKVDPHEKKKRGDGLRLVVGQSIVDELAHAKLFMVGAGAIGCELLKNYAMLGVGSKGGSIVLTDPDVIEVSNLNRQFLFREKHLRKPKSQTAAAAAIHMNPELKDCVIARLDKVHEGTAHIFTDSFFEGLSIVTNALDNLHARRYIDQRCVTAKTPLLESGTLGPKGHVQVILPYKTESYSSQVDPEDNTEIPHCTLKMFPEETLHCVEWARDIFGRLFTQGPQNVIKVVEEGPAALSQEESKLIKEALKIL